MRSCLYILVIVTAMLAAKTSFANDGSTVIFHDTMDTWSSSRYFDANEGTAYADSGAIQLNANSAADRISLFNDVNELIVHKGDIVVFQYQMAGWGYLPYADTNLLVLIDGIGYGYNTGETWVHNTEWRDPSNSIRTVQWTIPVTGVLNRFDFRLEWSHGGSARICDMQIIRPCTQETVLWSDDLESVATPPRFFGDSKLINDGAGFITFESNSVEVGVLSTEVLGAEGGLDVQKGDLFQTEFKIEDLGLNTGAVIGITYVIDSNTYYTPASGRELTFSDTVSHKLVYEIPASGKLTSVNFNAGFCKGTQISVFDYKIIRSQLSPVLAGDVQGSDMFPGDFDVDTFDLGVFVSNWLDTNGGTFGNNCDTYYEPGYFEFFNSGSCTITPVTEAGRTYLNAASWGANGWTICWRPNWMSSEEDPTGQSGMEIMSGDVLTFDVKGPVQDFEVAMIIRSMASTGVGVGSEQYFWPTDPNRIYNDGSYYTSIGEQWTTFRLVSPGTGKLTRVEFTAFDSTQQINLDNIKITRSVPSVKFHDDMENATFKRTYTDLTYTDLPGIIRLATVSGKTTGKVVTDMNTVNVYPGDLITAKFNVVALPTGATVNIKLGLTIDGFLYYTANPMYGSLGPQTFTYAVEKPDGWTGSALKLTKIAFVINGATYGTVVSVDDYTSGTLAIPVTKGDFNSDKKVNLQDLALLAQNWLKCLRPDCN